MNSKNANNYENVVIRKEQEVGINNFGLDYMVDLEDEIERLNNIINDMHNGLEKIIEQGYDYNEKDKIAIKLISKIRELKGSDKD